MAVPEAAEVIDGPHDSAPRSASNLMRAIVAGTSGSMALVQTLLVRFLTLGLNLLTGIISARFLGPVGRAEQAAIILGAGFFPYVVALGVPLAVQYKIGRNPDRANEYTSAGVALSLALGVLAVVAGVLVVPHMLAKYSPRIVAIAQIAMITAPVTVLYTILCSILQARGNFRATNATRYAIPALSLGALLVLIAVHRLNAVSASVAYLFTGFVVVPWLWNKVRPDLRARGLAGASKELLHYGLRSYVSDIIGTFAAQIDQILVIGLLSPASMGLYAVALGAARPVDLFSASITSVLFPRAAARELPDIVALTGRAARITGVLLVVTGTFLVAFMPVLVPLFFGRSFLASVPVAQIVLISFALNAIVYVLAQAYMAAGKPAVNATIQLAGLATTLPAMLVLIPRYGIRGAAIALVASTTVRLVSSLACFPIVLKVAAPSLLINAGDVAYLRRALSHHSHA